MKTFVKTSFLSLMLVAAFGIVLSSCKKDDKPSGSDERSIVSISFDGQVGNATINRTSDKAEVLFTWNTTSGSAASIEVKTLTISKDAKASVNVGDKMNFDNPNKTASITVTAENGTPLEWKVIMTPFTPEPGSNENAIVSISFKGQLGDATVSNSAVDFVYNTKHGGIGSIEVASIEVSDKATPSVTAGGKLNFDNMNKTATITVTAESGLAATWTLKVTDTAEPAEGKWMIKNLWLYGGHPQWDMSAVFQMPYQKTWLWNSDNGPKAECDNVLEIVLVGIDADGNNYGTFTHDAGEDGLFANFMFWETIDLNHIYRQIPIGSGTWVSDQTEGTFTFINEDDEEFVCEFGNKDNFNNFVFYEYDDDWENTASEKKPFLSLDGENFENSVNALMSNYVFMFDVRELGTGNFNWDDMYGDDSNKYRHGPMFFWVEVHKAE